MSHPPSLPSGAEHFPYTALSLPVRRLLTSRADEDPPGSGYFRGQGVLSEHVQCNEASENISTVAISVSRVLNMTLSKSW